METTTVRDGATVESETTTLRGPILVATDGSAQSNGALAVGRSLAATTGNTLQVIAVKRPLTLVVPDASLLLEPSVITRLTSELRDRVALQFTELAGDGNAPRLPEPEIFTGEPERVIAKLAVKRGASLIVLGLGGHNIIDRVLGSETALQTARVSSVPVLAVPSEMHRQPRRAVIGVDFSEPSLHALQIAFALLASGGVAHLVHVMARDREFLDQMISDAEYKEFIRHRFTRMKARLVVPPGLTIEEHICSGSAARELIGYAEQEQADLIAAGGHGHGRLARLVLGSVTTRLIRASKCAVLVVPPDAESAGEETLGSSTTHIEKTEWPTMLADFTRMNAGRRTQLEVDDPDIGAQAQETDYLLQGVAYDPHDGRIGIMLGGSAIGEPNLTRSIGGVSSLDVLSDQTGNDVALRVRHGAGQTLLTFVAS